jgi:preprotein translocase subunit SecG
VDVLVYISLGLQVLISVALVVFILLHSGKGTGLSSMFGGAMPTTSMGTSIVERNLDRITIGLAIGFAVNSLLLMLIYSPSA